MKGWLTYDVISDRQKETRQENTKFAVDNRDIE